MEHSANWASLSYWCGQQRICIDGLSSLVSVQSVVLAFIFPLAVALLFFGWFFFFCFFLARTLKHLNEHNLLLSSRCSGIVISVPASVSPVYISQGKNEFCEVSCIIVCAFVMCIMMCNIALERLKQWSKVESLLHVCFMFYQHCWQAVVTLTSATIYIIL